MNWKRAVVGAGIALPLVALLAYGLTQDPKAVKSPLPGLDAPNFTLETMGSGQKVTMADLRGQILVLNFWASWCIPCRQEHEALSQTATAYQNKNVRFFGILYQDAPANATKFIQEMGGQTYPTLLDPGDRTAIDFGLYGVPETFFVDHQGKVAEKIIGPVTAESMQKILDRLITAKTTTS